MPRLENWKIETNWTPYLAPECLAARLRGYLATPHPDGSLEVGRAVVTSNISVFDLANRRAVTKSGTVYELGEANEKWVGDAEKIFFGLMFPQENDDAEQEEVSIPKL